MTDTYLTLLEAFSDPWALALFSFFVAGLIVVSTALVVEPRPPIIESEEEDRPVVRLPEPLQYEPEDFFDKVTRFHREV